MLCIARGPMGEPSRQLMIAFKGKRAYVCDPVSSSMVENSQPWPLANLFEHDGTLLGQLLSAYQDRRFGELDRLWLTANPLRPAKGKPMHREQIG